MKIDEGTLAYIFLNDRQVPYEAAKSLTPYIDKSKATLEEIERHEGTWNVTFNLFNTQGNKTYYITKSVYDNLDLLKLGTNKDLNWSIVANAMKGIKCTYILPNGDLLRVYKYHPTRLGFAAIYFKDGLPYWSSGFIHTDTNYVSDNWKKDPKIQQYEMLLYKLMCFLYLTENEEQIIPAKTRFGTKKSGKVVNRLDVPITIVTSKWNITVIRNEGFTVSGHFRLQPTKQGHKMIYIEPFQKHGYIRRAKKESD